MGYCKSSQKHPSKVALGQKIGSKCRKMLSKLSVEKNHHQSLPAYLVKTRSRRSDGGK